MVFKIWIGFLIILFLLFVGIASAVLCDIEFGRSCDSNGFLGIFLVYPAIIGAVDLVIILVSLFIHWFIWG